MQYFEPFRNDIVGLNETFLTPYGEKLLTYIDWIASGRASHRVESAIAEILPRYGNSHSEDNFVGKTMTHYYHLAREKMRLHVNGSENDAVIFKGSGMTSAINWFQDMLGLKDTLLPASKRPVVFVTHMEHHSDQTSWLKSAADVFVVQPDSRGLPDLNHLTDLCKEYKDSGRPMYGSFTACSNVTGVTTDIHAMARIMHEHGGKCFADYAASAPYVKINMHPADPAEALDAVFFSTHKFFGGPGTPGVVIFNRDLYKRKDPVTIGGGIVKWTNPWGGVSFYDEIEAREDAGTPPLLQVIRSYYALDKKEEMGIANIHERKSELLRKAFEGLEKIEGISILAPYHRERQGIISFATKDKDIRYNLMATVLSDYFGIQSRAGCSCAGTYGHVLFGIDRLQSKKITDRIEQGDHSSKPGWVRFSLHPTMSDEELSTVIGAIEYIMAEKERFKAEYSYDRSRNAWDYKARSKIPHLPILPSARN